MFSSYRTSALPADLRDGRSQSVKMEIEDVQGIACTVKGWRIRSPAAIPMYPCSKIWTRRVQEIIVRFRGGVDW
jgi:hypothetical protein